MIEILHNACIEHGKPLKLLTDQGRGFYTEAKRGFTDYIKSYNFDRPHQGIGGARPSDRFYGVIGDTSRISVPSLLGGVPQILSAFDDDRGGLSGYLDLLEEFPDAEIKAYDLEGHKDPNDLLIGKARKFFAARKDSSSEIRLNFAERYIGILGDLQGRKMEMRFLENRVAPGIIVA